MPTLLMIHGVGCDAGAWDVMKPGFEAAGWTCEAITLFPDRRVRQNPPANLPDLGIADYIEAAAAEARRLAARDGAPSAVIGHSMGGLIAQVLAERGEVSKAVFLTPAQPKDCAAIGLPVVWTFLNIIAKQDRTKSYKVWKTGFKWGVLNRVPVDRHDAVYAAALYDSGKVYGDITDGVTVDESRVMIPTLTIAAGQDRATLPKGVRKVAAKYARSPVAGEFLEYPGHGHWIVDEPGTDKVVADIAAWLGRAA
ncbi:MAG: alpha/beta hydrolase [Hyphomonas sp.]